jgi:hypothetical protein
MQIFGFPAVLKALSLRAALSVSEEELSGEPSKVESITLMVMKFDAKIAKNRVNTRWLVYGPSHSAQESYMYSVAPSVTLSYQ